jgi:simple sugar transport system substrate-binding protein
MEKYELPISAYVGQIETVVGGTAGLHSRDLVEKAGGSVDVALGVKGMNEAAWAVQRCEGFAAALAPLGIEVTTLGGDFYADPPAIPTDAIAEWFAANPGVDIVFATAFGPLSLMLSMKEDGVIPAGALLGTVDLDPSTIDAIRAGTCAFAVDQQPYLQGYLPVTLLDLESNYLLRMAADVQTGPFFVDASNLDQVADLMASGYR